MLFRKYSSLALLAAVSFSSPASDSYVRSIAQGVWVSQPGQLAEYDQGGAAAKALTTWGAVRAYAGSFAEANYAVASSAFSVRVHLSGTSHFALYYNVDASISANQISADDPTAFASFNTYAIRGLAGGGTEMLFSFDAETRASGTDSASLGNEVVTGPAGSFAGPHAASEVSCGLFHAGWNEILMTETVRGAYGGVADVFNTGRISQVILPDSVAR